MQLDPMAASATSPPRGRCPCAGIAVGSIRGYTFSMKAAVLTPDPLFKEAQAAAKELGITRSKLVRIALEAFLDRRRGEEVTRRPNESYAKRPGKIDPVLQNLVLEAMKRVEWKD